jgi:hypothetical protein
VQEVEWTVLDSVSFMVIVLCHFSILFLSRNLWSLLMTVRYIGHWGDDSAPLEAARMSTGNPTGVDLVKDIKLRQYLWDNEHHSPLSLARWSSRWSAPIFVARQWMRHRTFSYNEFSWTLRRDAYGLLVA